jgi:cytochrome c-type biogenesis protein CcmH
MATSSPRLDDLKRQRAQIDDLVTQGVLGEEAARQAREKIEKLMVQAVLEEGGAPAPPAPAEPAAAAVERARPSRALVGGVVAFVLIFGVLGYAWRGNKEALGVGPGETGPVAAAEGAAAGHAVTNQQIEGMVTKLAERLKDKPDDAEGWAMLARSYTALGRHADALPAYQKVVALRPKDAQALADLADGLAVANNRTLDGEPERLIMQAVKLDPRNVKALELAGTVAFNRNDFKTASDYWQKAVDASEPGSEFARQLQVAAGEARQRAGLEPAATDAPATAGAAPAAAGGARISGRVSLAKALQGKVAPGDTVFIFARATAGPKMPLAILRKQAGDLPMTFTLDDSLAMSPAATLSSVREVIVGARISKSGNAIAQPGDLQVLSAPVAVGAQGVALDIAEVVR